MKIKISLYYHTQWGQALCICGSIPELGDSDENKSVDMIYTGLGMWSIEVEVNGGYSQIQYRFLVKENGITLRREWGNPHILITERNQYFDILDKWQDAPSQQYLYTSAFAASFFTHLHTSELYYYYNTLLMIVNCPYVKSDEELIITGEGLLLAEWDTSKAIALHYISDNQWQLPIDASRIDKETQYKLAIRNKESQKITHWEIGGNRILHPISGQNMVKGEVIDYLHEPMYWRASGVAIPVFSLRSKDSFGIGDFPDLMKTIDWAVKSGQKVIQLLPVNDTTTTRTWLDSYPYNCISNYALHPLYLGLKEHPIQNTDLNNEFLRKAEVLNDLEAVDYEAVLQLKSDYLHELYREKGSFILGEYDFLEFYRQNEEWLFPYACFCCLRDKYKTADTARWAEYKVYNREKLEDLAQSDFSVKNSLQITYFTQYLLHLQLTKAKEYAHKNKVILKGDIPIGVNRNSVEAWTEPHLFNLDSQTGAPPDDFSINGQNWTFPTYNWDEMSKDGYRWWKNRFQKMADYFDAYRIDHILGFFRIWEIPMSSVQGMLGYFSPALPLSVDEIQSYGINFGEEQTTNAIVDMQAIDKLFGQYSQEVVSTYLHQIDEQKFGLNEDCNTQRKVEQLFTDRSDEKSQAIRNGLYEVCNEVLFIRDKKESHKYHPRISAYQSFTYKRLTKEEQDAYNHLYEDFFYHRHNQFWADRAMVKLPALVGSTSMLVCGEDLGMIPACVPEVMNELQILSLEIERMPKEFGVEFGSTSRYSFMSVCTTSTHDMSPIRLWWGENREITQRYYSSVLLREGDAPQECDSDICWQILNNHLRSPSMLCIIPLQDWLSFWDDLRRADASAERINLPSNPQHYWRYRMHLFLEDLLTADAYNNSVKKMIADAQRN